MTVNWPLVFQAVKTVLDPLAAASWPIAFGIVAWAFQKPITAMIERIRQLSGFGGTADFATGEGVAHQQPPAEGSESAKLPALADVGKPPPSDPVYDILDGQLEAVLNQGIVGNTEIKLAWAIRQRSFSEANRIHETNYRFIFGSQIHALRTLNGVGQGPVSYFEKYYETVATNPAWEAIHKDRTFEQWWEFLVNANYIALVDHSEPPLVQITPFGHQFLQWMVRAHASDFKPG